jgi:hypothetical protein
MGYYIPGRNHLLGFGPRCPATACPLYRGIKRNRAVYREEYIKAGVFEWRLDPGDIAGYIEGGI